MTLALLKPLVLAVALMHPPCAPAVHTHPALRPGVAFADPATCTVYLPRRWRDAWGPDLCTTMVHEVGHLARRTHSSERLSVMYPRAVYPLPECKRMYGLRGGIGPESHL